MKILRYLGLITAIICGVYNNTNGVIIGGLMILVDVAEHLKDVAANVDRLRQMLKGKR